MIQKQRTQEFAKVDYFTPEKLDKLVKTDKKGTF